MPSRRSFLRFVGGSVAASCATRQQSCQAAAEPAAAQGIAVTIGLNQLEPQHYVDAPPLRGCVQDAKDVYAIARQAGFTCDDPLLNEKATREAVIKALEDAAQKLRAGDIFLLHFSGHGGQIRDDSGDELSDGLDETWCLYDAMLLDDELALLLTKFKKDVRILVLSDSCHSGTIVKGNGFLAAFAAGNDHFRGTEEAKGLPVFRYLPEKSATSTYKKNKEFYTKLVAATEGEEPEPQANILLISGCQDNQLSADLTNNGLFTAAVKKVWDDGKYRGTYREFHAAIVRLLPQSQSPNYYPAGEINVKFWRQQPFTVTAPT